MQDEPYSGNLPASGSMRSGSLYARPTWVPHTSGGECLYWRTPAAGHPAKGGSQSPAKRLAGGHTLDLQDQAEYWPTPTTQDGKHASNSPAQDGRNGLVIAALQWPTARGSDGEKGGPNQAGSKGDLTLPSAAAQWPTPAGRDWKSGEASEATATKNARPLSEVAIRRNWATPRAEQGASHVNTSGGESVATQAEAFFLQDPETLTDGGESLPSVPTSRRRLNPHFVDWLQGFPTGWSSTAPNDQAAYEAWVTQCARLVARSRSSSFFAESQEVKIE